jgi:hypothetical protein
MHNFFEWLKDRRYTLIGGIISVLGVFLIVLHCFFNGLGMDELFGNVLVNTVLTFGIVMYRYGQKNDAYKNISEE